ncbi:MAG: 50S ribosome-binding GTPase [Deltaproteobacteria bacterium]|jgi:predicted GTPase|nr:50S ribosome-binding GTPase [Deltaproteobacteria bacterium]
MLNATIIEKLSIQDLIRNNSEFKPLNYLTYKSTNKDKFFQWTISDKPVNCLQVLFIGKTGYGKSTTLNKITKTTNFATSDIDSCTKKIETIEYRLNNSDNIYPCYLSFCDMPGIGESLSTNNDYIKLYIDMIEYCTSVIYILRADTRDFNLDLDFFEKLRNYNFNINLIIGLNYADKIEPINRNSLYSINSQQARNLDIKKDEISKLFKISTNNIVYYSAANNFNLNNLVKKIVDSIPI